MAVFDHGQFSARQKRYSKKHLKDWKDGFSDGYQAALDRYITLNKRGATSRSYAPKETKNEDATEHT